MRDFNQNRYSNSGGGNRFERRNSDRTNFNRGSDDRQMFPAVCDNCGKDCEVPFKPTGEKPIYCNDCFRKMRGESDGKNDRSDRRESRNQSFGNREERSFRPQEERHTNPGNADFKQQLDAINSKLNQILKALEPPVLEKEIVEPIVKEVKAEKVAAKPEDKTKAKKATAKKKKSE